MAVREPMLENHDLQENVYHSYHKHDLITVRFIPLSLSLSLFPSHYLDKIVISRYSSETKVSGCHKIDRSSGVS